jgi:hypothetical protein
MTEFELFVGCIAVVASFAFVFTRVRTAFFGLTALTVFHVASETTSGFLVAYIFDLEMDSWFTPEHAEVVFNSILGLLAMAAGIFIGWLPAISSRSLSPQEKLYLSAPAHINERVGWLTFLVGAGAELVIPFVWQIPTVGTAVNCISALARIGLLILVLAAIQTKRWNRFFIAMALFVPLSILGSLASGFSFLRTNTILPILFILFASSGFAIRYVLPSIVAVPFLLTGISAWMETRAIIRDRSLDGLPVLEQVATFFREYVSNLSIPTPDSILNLFLTRIDMTEILAAQVRHQPEYEPYALGETVYTAFYTLIPRFIWPEKPVVAGGSEFITRFTGMVRPAEDITSIGVSYPFELYANGGPIVVIVGLGVIGYICAKLELRLFQPTRSLATFWALALVLGVLSEGGQRTDVVLPAMVAAGLAAFALGKFLEKSGLSRDMLLPADHPLANRPFSRRVSWIPSRRRPADPGKYR